MFLLKLFLGFPIVAWLTLVLIFLIWRMVRKYFYAHLGTWMHMGIYFAEKKKILKYLQIIWLLDLSIIGLAILIELSS